MKCEICNRKINDLRGLSSHLSQIHKDMNKKEYYDKYLKKEDEGRCHFCGKESIFFNVVKGYHRICDSKECLGKTRATGTYEFLMYKYNLSEKDAITLMNERSSERGKKIKESLDKKLLENPNFHKEKSHQTKEYWIKRGYSEDEANIKIKDIMDNIHRKTSLKRINNPELYDDKYKNQIKYWIKNGFTEEEAKQKVSDRQRTFTLEKCIKKYGEIEGLKVWNERQQKWSESMKDTLLNNGNYKKDYSMIEKELMDMIISKKQLKINEYYCYSNDQFFIYDNDNKRYNSYDFVLKSNKKVIEFNGDYWHCNPVYYKENFFNKRKQMFAKEIWKYDNYRIDKIKSLGYEVLVIWESDYKKNKEEIVQRCIDFLND